MSRPDEIMAQYLLKGGKMLAESCPVCHNPFFEYKGQRQCVVCQHTETVQKSAHEEVTKNSSPPLICSDPLQGQKQGQNIHADDTVQQAAYKALLHTLSCITQENNVHSISELSASSAMLTKVYLRLSNLQSGS